MTRPLRLLLAGEGVNDLGGWAGDPAYRDPRRLGALTALLAKVSPSGWEVVDAIEWKQIVKLAPGGFATAEMRNVLGAIKRARDLRCDGLAFIRDTDGRVRRRQEIEAALVEARKRFPESIRVIGSPVVPCLEGWALALLGHRGTENLSTPRATATLNAAGVVGTEAIVEVIGRGALDQLPDDAVSLKSWVGRAREHLRAGG